MKKYVVIGFLFCFAATSGTKVFAQQGAVHETPGEVTTLAGSGQKGFQDSNDPFSAHFYEPTSVAVRGGQLYVVDSANHRLRTVNLITGTVTTLAGDGQALTTDGVGTAVSFNSPAFIEVSGTHAYVSEEGGHVIRKINLETFAVTTLAGSGEPGSVDGTGTDAQFNEPLGMAIIDDSLYVADIANFSIRRINLNTAEVTTIAGGTQGDTDGIGSVAKFMEPVGLAAKGNYLYLTDFGARKIKKINRNTYDVTTIAGSDSGFADGVAAEALFARPVGIDISGNNLVISDHENNKIRKLNLVNNAVSTIAGSGVAGFANGLGTLAALDGPAGLAIGPVGNIYVADRNNHRIRRIEPLQALDPRQIRQILSLDATVSISLSGDTLTVPITIPVDTTMFSLGTLNVLGPKDLSGFSVSLPSGDTLRGDSLQPFMDDLENMAINIPDVNIDETDGTTLYVTIKNIDATDLNNLRITPIVVNGDTINTFFFIGLTIEKDGVVFDRFDFRDGSPLMFRLPVGALTQLLNNSGFSGVDSSKLALVFLGEDGHPKQEGIFSMYDPNSQELVVAVTHLSDIVGINKDDIPEPRKASIVAGPSVEPDTASATITWRTSEATNTVLSFGTASDSLSEQVEVEADSVGVKNHTLVLSGLSLATTYYFQINAKDPFGRTFTSAVDSFRTRGIADLAPPVFVGIPSLTERSAKSAGFLMRTDRRTTVAAHFDTAGAGTLTQLVEDNDKKKIHLITLSGLTADERYQVVFSATGSQTVSSDTLSFRTRATVDTLPPVFRVRKVDDFAITDTTAIISIVSIFPVQIEAFYWEADSTDTLSEMVSDPSTSPTAILTNLKPETRYKYYVKATRSNGQSVVSGTNRFRTKGAGRAPPLRFTRAPSVGYKSDELAVISWRTNIPSNGYVYFQLDSNETGTFNIDEAFVRGSDDFTRNHRLVLPGLIAGERYLVVITSQSPDGRFLIWPPETQFNTAQPVVSGGKLFITGIVQVPGSNGQFTTNTQPDTQAPIILNGPSVVAQADNQLVVQWETDELSSSQVDFGIGGNLNETTTSSEQVTLHQVTLTNLTPNTSYDFTVSSIDPSNNGPTTSTQAVGLTVATADVTPPVIDDASIASAPSDDRVIIAWTTDEGADSDVQFGTSADSLETTVSDLAIVTDHQVTLTGLDESTQYFYKVLATDVTGNGPSTSATFTFTTSAAPDTATPAVSNVATSTSTQPDSTATVTFSWTTDKLASSFVEYDTLSDLSTQITTGTQTGAISHSVTVTGLNLGRTYYFQIGSENVLDQSVPRPQAKSDLDSVTTPTDVDMTEPEPPATATAVPGNGAVMVRWDASTDPSGIKGYNITRNGTTIATNVTEVELLDPTVNNDTTYTYTVTAIDNAANVGTSATSTSAVTPATTQVATAPTATVPATGDTVSLKPILVVANATAVSGDPSRATLTYTFQVATDAGFTSVIASKEGIDEGTNGNPTNWQVLDLGQPDSTALTDGVTYYWRSKANDGSFAGDWSANQSFVASAAKPTTVTLVTMAAESDRGVVIVTWSIGTADPALSGFHVLRSLKQDGGFERLTDELITGNDVFEFRDGAVQVKQQYFYMIEAVSSNGETRRFGPISLRVDAPSTFALKQNAPNPFNPATTIRFDLPNPIKVTVIVYNILGQEVIRLINDEAMEAGFHEISWNGRNQIGSSTASGIYLYRIEAGEFSKARKMLLLK